MKRLILSLALILCFPLSSHAIGPMMMGGGPPAAAGPTCTGDTLFIWECTSTTVTDGGCSVGDTTATAVSAATISSGECVFGNADYYTFAISSDDILKPDSSTIFMRFKVNTALVNTANLFRAIALTNEDQARIYTSATNIIVLYEGDNDAGQVATVAINADTYYIVRARWRTGDTDPPIDISVYNSDCTALVIADTNNTTNITLMDNAWAGEDLWVGNDTAVDVSEVVDYIHIYSGWKDTDPNGACATLP